MRSHQPGFLTVYLHVSFRQTDLPGADRLDLAALECDPCFEGFDQKVFEFCLAIGRNSFDGIHDSILPQPSSPFQDSQPGEKTQQRDQDQRSHQADGVRDERTCE